MPDTTSMGPIVEPMLISYTIEINSKNMSLDLKFLVISY